MLSLLAAAVSGCNGAMCERALMGPRDRQSRLPPGHVLPSSEERSAADPVDAVPHPRFVGASVYLDDQRTTGPLTEVRRHRPSRSRLCRAADVGRCESGTGPVKAVRGFGEVLLNQFAGLKVKVEELERRLRTSAL